MKRLGFNTSRTIGTLRTLRSPVEADALLPTIETPDQADTVKAARRIDYAAFVIAVWGAVCLVVRCDAPHWR